MAEREGVVKDEKDSVETLARNNPPMIPCIVCGKPATKVEGGYYFGVEEHAYCDEHARKAKDVEMMLPIVNSPRVVYVAIQEMQSGKMKSWMMTRKMRNST